MSTTGGTDPIEPATSAVGSASAEHAEILEAGKARGPARGRRTWVLAVAGIAVVAAAGAGFAVGAVLGGGGTQPEDVLPDTVLAYVDLDLDPAAEQKVNLVRLLGRFPDVEEEYGPEPDIRTVVVDWLAEGTELEDAEIDQWIGDRVGVGISWDDEVDTLTPVAAIQVSDVDEAVADLQLVLEDDQIAITDDYVVVTGDLFSDMDELVGLNDLVEADVPGSQTAEQVVAAGEAAPLSQSDAYTGVFDRLDDGLLTMYVDGERIAAAGEQLVDALDLDGSPDAAGLTGALAQAADAGQSGAVLRAEPNAIELVAWSGAVAQGDGSPAELMASLPDSTLFAVELTGGAELVAERWTEVLESAESGDLAPGELERGLAELEAQYGIALPDDLETLMGDDLVLAVDGAGLLTGVPGIGVRSVTDPVAGDDLAARIESALASLTGGFGITARGTADGMVVASSEEYASTLSDGASGEGALGSDPTFQDALPDADDATNLVWVDLSAVSSFAALTAPDASGVIEPLEALGVTVTPDDGGSLARARLVFGDATDS